MSLVSRGLYQRECNLRQLLDSTQTFSGSMESVTGHMRLYKIRHQMNSTGRSGEAKPLSTVKRDHMASPKYKQVGGCSWARRRQRFSGLLEMELGHVEIGTVNRGLRFIFRQKPQVLLNNPQGNLPEVSRIW